MSVKLWSRERKLVRVRKFELSEFELSSSTVLSQAPICWGSSVSQKSRLVGKSTFLSCFVISRSKENCSFFKHYTLFQFFFPFSRSRRAKVHLRSQFSSSLATTVFIFFLRKLFYTPMLSNFILYFLFSNKTKLCLNNWRERRKL